MADLNLPSPERTAALIEIYALVNRYAYLARDNARWDALARLVHPNATLNIPDKETMPLLEIKNVLRLDRVKYLRHNVTAIDVHFESETQAHVNTQLFASTDWSGRDHWGEWRDVITRTSDGTWLIKDRTVVIEGADPEGWAASNPPA